MNRLYGKTYSIQSAVRRSRDGGVRALLFATALMVAGVPAIGQAGGADLQAKLAEVKQSVAANQQKLRQYQWIETTQLTLNGDAKPSSQSLCRYGPDGTVQKTQISAPPPPPSGGRLKQKIIANKKDEMQQYMGGVKNVIGMYVPPDPQKMQAAFQAQKVTMNSVVGSGTSQLVFKDYAQPGDQMTITFNSATKKVTALNVNTYMDNPKDVVTLTVQFASLPDGTNYVVQNVLDATAKKLVVTTTSSNYQPAGPQ